MTRSFRMMAAMGTLALAIGVGTAADEKKAKSTKEIMKACTGSGGLAASTAKFAKASNWEKAAKSAEGLKEFSAQLPDAKPKKGDLDSWKTLSTKFAEQGVAIYDAVEKKDNGAVQTAVKEFGGSCKACHDVHKGK